MKLHITIQDTRTVVDANASTSYYGQQKYKQEDYERVAIDATASNGVVAQILRGIADNLDAEQNMAVTR